MGLPLVHNVGMPRARVVGLWVVRVVVAAVGVVRMHGWVFVRRDVVRIVVWWNVVWVVVWWDVVWVVVWWDVVRVVVWWDVVLWGFIWRWMNYNVRVGCRVLHLRVVVAFRVERDGWCLVLDPRPFVVGRVLWWVEEGRFVSPHVIELILCRILMMLLMMMLLLLPLPLD
jgi:hypothetical protein